MVGVWEEEESHYGLQLSTRQVWLLGDGMVFKFKPFNEPLKGEVQDFQNRSEVEPRSNHNDVIISLIIFENINKYIKFIKLAKLTNISIYVREI